MVHAPGTILSERKAPGYGVCMPVQPTRAVSWQSSTELKKTSKMSHLVGSYMGGVGTSVLAK